jgi:hypothetical protein
MLALGPSPLRSKECPHLAIRIAQRNSIARGASEHRDEAAVEFAADDVIDHLAVGRIGWITLAEVAPKPGLAGGLVAGRREICDVLRDARLNRDESSGDRRDPLMALSRLRGDRTEPPEQPILNSPRPVG